ncbi:MAG TPA: ATP-dependent zinc metalloprotease FtsH [Candidatus Scatavimonas merdigallinarum]|uniref:ATP-dependent zinc metalloprotease FtsH n=1 Tax=Candidatus Scatavimonas merdigallinarum TaxID=2840914 RepID=A0A9D0ZJ82_9FIRM|nr:ATP-dependent zinc metalloprotease FtsH [Candidatus Scatavimonas merdigallinarum]
MDNKKTLRNLLIYLGIPIVLILVIVTIFQTQPKITYNYSDIIGAFRDGKVDSFTLNLGSGEMEITLKEGQTVENTSASAQNQPILPPQTQSGISGTGEGQKDSRQVIKYTAPSAAIAYDDISAYINPNTATNEENPNYDPDIQYDLIKGSENSWIISLLPNIIMIVLLVVFWLYIMRKMSGGLGGDPTKQMGFGKAKIKDMNDEKRKTTFEDVAGADEEKEELEEIVEFLKNPQKYNDLGARIPKGVLLVGPPGTGKTLLARAVAGEAGVPFFSISGSDFVEMFVGVGASRVRDLFDQAKKNSPCIIFIDEIDAVGRQRGTGLGGGHDEREQTLNQLLVEMDGFGVNEGVIMIAATNRPDILDPALMRPGRFDRQVVVGYPDIKGREAILKVHARKKPLAPDVKLSTVAKSTAGFTGADLENLLNEAALLAARKGRKAITMQEIEEATIKVVVGAEKKTRVMNEKEKKLTAYHEAGHAIAFHVCETQDPVHQISIIPTGLAGGYTMPLPAEDKSYNSRQEMKESIIVGLSGRVAEALVIGDISTGASNDIEKASKTARAMVTKYGMSELLGPISYGSSGNEVFIGRDMGHVKDYSEKTAAKIDDEVYAIIEEGYSRAEEILRAHMQQLHAVAKFLIKHEKMDNEQFEAVMNGTYVEPPEELEEEQDKAPAEIQEDTTEK